MLCGQGLVLPDSDHNSYLLDHSPPHTHFPLVRCPGKATVNIIKWQVDETDLSPHCCHSLIELQYWILLNRGTSSSQLWLPYRIAQTGWLKQNRLVFLQFWRLEVQVLSALVLVRPLVLACRWPPSHRVLMQPFPLCARSQSSSSSSHKDVSPMELGPYLLWPRLILTTLLKVPVSKFCHIRS